MGHDKRSTVLSFMSDDALRRGQENRTDTVHRLALNEVRPDPGQPRHLLPPELAAQLYGGDLPPLIILKTLIEKSQTDETLANVVDSIVTLATDIKENGLINPITVYEPEGQLTHYTIETGERRYWAHWYLAHQGDESFRQIRALIVSGKNSRMRQLSENLRRDGLTAVETAIGLTSLIVELQNEPIANDWYKSETIVQPALRRMADQRLQYGTWPRVIERLGYGRQHWHNYLNLLKLCDEALEMAHRHRLPERQLRPITAIKNPVEQILAVSALLTGGESPLTATTPKEKPQKTGGTKKPPIEMWQSAIDKFYRSIGPISDDINIIRDTITTDAEQRQRLVEIREHLDKILSS